jgi:flavin reductase (DIM6/NTAB) family NADH-FMN oxidoreductase RutF
MAFFSSPDIAAMEQRHRAALINSIGGFKSVVLVGTCDSEGSANLAIFNSLFHLGAHPPLCGLIFRPDSVERHTLSNIESTGVYTINHLTQSIYTKAHQTAARYPQEQSEFEAVGLTPKFEEGILAPFVSESPLRFSLKLREKIPLEINGTILIIGQITNIWLPEGVIQADGFVDLEQAGTLTCSGLDSYHRTQRIARLSYPKPGSWPSKIPLLPA